MAYTTSAVTNPVTITPRTVSIGFLVGPALPTSALISSNARTASKRRPQRPRLPAALSGKCVAAPIKKSIGKDITTLLRDARKARRAAPAATGFACPPPAVATAFAITIFWFGQITSHTLRNISRSEEHTSELQSRLHLVCRLLLEKKKRRH